MFNDLKKFLEAYDLYYNKIFKSENVPASEDDGTEDSIKTILEGIKKYIVSKGFVYDQKLIDNFYISLKTKPFVLLAGTSGTGKTRLVRLFAEAIGAMDEGRYLQVPVRPDWSDSTDLFGHVNLNNQFIPGVIIDFIKNAYENKDMPYILCLDEMNLARVEYYLSDFLSIIETRDWKGNEIVTDELVPKMCFSGDKDAEKKYKHMIFPENLYLIGTVNMDETTFPFSKKVLDRANTIEFSSVDFDLPDPLSDGESPAEKVFVKNDFLRSDYLRLLKDCTDFEEIIRRQNEQISKINEILKESDVHFGYRMRDDMIFYMLYNTKSDLINEDEAFDNQINQKILPRIHGGSESVAKILRRLFSEICAGPYEDNSSTKDSYKMENYMKENNCIYPKSAEKIWKMLRRFEEDDFTSYWI